MANGAHGRHAQRHVERNRQLLARESVRFRAHVKEIGEIESKLFMLQNITRMIRQIVKN